MKIKVLNLKTLAVAVALTGAFALVSCDNQKKEKTTTQEVVIERDADGNISDFSVYTYEQKDGVVKAAEQELDKLNAKIGELKAEMDAKAADLSDDAKANYEKAVADLEKTRDDYNSKVNALKNSTEEGWDKAKSDVNNAYKNAESGVKQGWENLKQGVSDVAGDVKEGADKAVKDAKEGADKAVQNVKDALK